MSETRDPMLLETLPDEEARRDSRPTFEVPQNYESRGVIGRGGMGEVIAAHDRRIGRDVAIKRMRSGGDEAAIARFLREAKIQARLDHPAIVPVYELGADATGMPYFAMKRLAGTTLQAKIAAEPATIQPLLRAFAEACRAIELAHARGVIHRDLKPENIMLGDYGEVYVLDWGLARVLGEADPPISPHHHPIVDRDTPAGTLFGTPGYMSPEQAKDASTAGPATDVYALGAILFELLAGAPLHPRGMERAIASTLAGTDGSPAHRAPDRGIALELDALCTRALATDPAARPTAGELARAIEHYLDGDRDVERRRAMAVDQLARARASLGAGDRSEAMRAAGRALALDPENRGAAELVGVLMLEPPAQPPPELQRSIDDAEGKLVARHALVGAASYGAFVAMTPIAIWAGVLSWLLIVTVAALTFGLAIFALWIARNPGIGTRVLVAYLIGNAATAFMIERLFGPFVFVPAFAVLSTMSLFSYPRLAAQKGPLIACQLAAWAAPLVCELTGLIGRTWEFHDHALVIHSQMLQLGGAPSMLLLLAMNGGLVLLGGILAGGVANARIAAQRELMTRDWHMSQLLPALPDP